MKEFEVLELENGIRVVHKQQESTKIAHLGIMLDIGSRDELPEEQGLAHFWEHMAFKGTEKRKAYHIINRLESLGGELNAYTTKEKICFYASILSTHLDKTVELLSDITFHSIFPEKQIDRERQVILEEMSMYRDSPEDSIQDDFDEIVFKDHPLGKNILGTSETVRNFHKNHFIDFIERNLNTHKIVLTSVGNYPLKKLEKIVRKYLQDVPYKNHTESRKLFLEGKPEAKVISRPISQVHYALGMPSYDLRDKKRIPFFMLCNILGGPAMNSRLNLSLREKHGYVYGVEAQYTPYIDTGLFSIFFATDPSTFRKSVNLVQKEFEQLKKKPLGSLQLNNAKQQLKGQLAMSEENNNSMMLMMGKSLLDLDKVPDLDSIFKTIDQVTATDLQDLAIENFDRDRMSSLTYFPAD